MRRKISRIFKIFLTECSQQLDPAHHGGGEVAVHAGLECLEDVDGLEDDHVDSTPVLDSLEDESDEERDQGGLPAQL